MARPIFIIFYVYLTAKMKFFITFVLLIASISALPQEEPVAERNIITDQIIEAIEDLSQNIKDAGLDPLHIKREAGSYALPVPVIFNAAGFCEELLSTGLSYIVINRINYNVLSFTLTFDIEIPHIHLSAQSAVGEAVIFDNKLFGDASGSIDAYSVKVKGSVRVGVLGGITARTVNIDFNMGRIDSNINLSIQGYNLSNLVNTFLGETIPNKLQELKRDVDELISIIVLDYINENVL